MAAATAASLAVAAMMMAAALLLTITETTPVPETVMAMVLPPPPRFHRTPLPPSPAMDESPLSSDQRDGNARAFAGSGDGLSTAAAGGDASARRKVLSSLVAAAAACPAGLASALAIGVSPPAEAAPYNPLNLKGSYWETGELYQKKPTGADGDIPYDPADLLAFLKEAASALESLESLAEEGRFDEMSRSLRGGSVSETRLRLSGNALVDRIFDDDRGYVAAERFRVFLLQFDALDAAVGSAARRLRADGGIASTLALSTVAPLGAIGQAARMASDAKAGGGRAGGLAGDSRLEVLAALEGALNSLRAFMTAAEEGLGP